MAEYISREAAYKAVTRTCNNNCRGHVCLYTEDMLDDLEDIPAVDVQPVKRGRWIKRKGWFSSQVKCSLCGNFLDMDGVNAGRGDANYCPNCGADMRETNNDKS